MSEWGSESSSMEQDREVRALAYEVLGRDLMSSDLHEAYAHAGVSRPPRMLPPNLKKYQADRLIDYLKDLKTSKRKDRIASASEPEPCLYCTFGCDLCEEANVA